MGEYLPQTILIPALSKEHIEVSIAYEHEVVSALHTPN